MMTSLRGYFHVSRGGCWIDFIIIPNYTLIKRSFDITLKCFIFARVENIVKVSLVVGLVWPLIKYMTKFKNIGLIIRVKNLSRWTHLKLYQFRLDWNEGESRNKTIITFSHNSITCKCGSILLIRIPWNHLLKRKSKILVF